MRAEDIVGVSFFALLFPAIVVAIAGSRTTLTSRQRALWGGSGFSLISVSFFAFGLVSFQLIHNSPLRVVEGNLWDIRVSSADSTRFMITDAGGHAVLIQCRYTGPGLLQGERARVRYVAYNRKLVELDMLTGPFQVWHLRESSGEQDCWWWVAIGVVCAFFAYRQMAKVRHGPRTAP